MALEIPCIDDRPRVITLVPMENANWSFPTSPIGPGDVAVVMATADHTEVLHTFGDDLELDVMAEFCSSGNVFSVHPKRTFMLAAYWRMLRGDKSAKDWLRIFSNTTDLCEAFYKPVNYITFEERNNFGMLAIANALKQDWGPGYSQYDDRAIEGAAKMILDLCQRIHTEH